MPEHPIAITFTDDAHETYTDLLAWIARRGWYIRLDSQTVQLTGTQGDTLSYQPVDENSGQPVGPPAQRSLRDDNGLLTLTTFEIL
jgi:hypothetical protein